MSPGTPEPTAFVDPASETTDCAAQATGRLREYLLRHPCVSLQRASFSASPNGRDRAVVSTAWIEMADEQRAAQLRAVLDEYGSGHIRPLDRRVRLTGQRYRSSRDGSLVTTSEAEPVAGSVPGRVLDRLADDAAG